jgi:hypothetical protein
VGGNQDPQPQIVQAEPSPDLQELTAFQPLPGQAAEDSTLAGPLCAKGSTVMWVSPGTHTMSSVAWRSQLDPPW